MIVKKSVCTSLKTLHFHYKNNPVNAFSCENHTKHINIQFGQILEFVVTFKAIVKLGKKYVHGDSPET